MIDSFQKFVVLTFEDQDNDDTRRHYGGKVSQAALRRVLVYHQHVFPISELASKVGSELGLSGIPSVEAAFMFETLEKRTRAILAGLRVV